MDLLALRNQIDDCLREQDPDAMAVVLEEARKRIEDLRAAEAGPPDKINARTYVQEHFRAILERAGVTSGRVAELGAPNQSFAPTFPDFEWEFLSIVPSEKPTVLLADITECPHIPDETYDVVFSISVMEHVAQPWSAAHEIRRILKPGGIVYHAAPFSYFFHGAPEDYWRYTPTAMQSLFPDFQCLHASFYGKNRRRNNHGSTNNRVDQFGGPQFAVDAFGGWRENWFTLYAGRKTFRAAREFQRQQMHRLAIDTVAALGGDDAVSDELFAEAARWVALIRFDRDGNRVIRATPRKASLTPGRIAYLWDNREELKLEPSAKRTVVAHLIAQARAADATE